MFKNIQKCPMPGYGVMMDRITNKKEEEVDCKNYNFNFRLTASQK